MKACRYCIATKGFRLGDGHAFETDEQLIDHIEMEHDIPVTREGESEAETLVRFKAKNPRAGGPDCQCPSCLARVDMRHVLVDSLLRAAPD